MFLGQNRKGIEAAGFSIIIAIAILLLSAGVIFAGIKYTASKFDEKSQVEWCRILNEIKFGLREKTSGALTSGQSICATINKHTDEKLFVPTSSYKQDKEGAELEIRDMIKNCWYMWLEGSKPNMFRDYPFSESCFTCYTFKFKDKAKDVTSTSVFNSMDSPYYVKDTSDKCAPGGGGYWRQKCNSDEKAVTPKTLQINSDLKCCIKTVRSDCENKGGVCSSTGKPSEDYALYNKLSCQKGAQSCYVKKDGLYSYTRYIRGFTSRGGEVFFKPLDDKQTTEINYIPGEIYAVSFFSPSKQICLKGADPGAGCYAMIGAYAVGLGLGGIVIAKVSLVGGALTILGKSLLSVVGSNVLLTLGAYQIGIIDNLAKGAADWALSGVTIDVPNFIVVSTLNDAKEMGCAIDYGA